MKIWRCPICRKNNFLNMTFSKLITFRSWKCSSCGQELEVRRFGSRVFDFWGFLVFPGIILLFLMNWRVSTIVLFFVALVLLFDGVKVKEKRLNLFPKRGGES